MTMPLFKGRSATLKTVEKSWASALIVCCLVAQEEAKEQKIKYKNYLAVNLEPIKNNISLHRSTCSKFLALEF